MKKITSIVAIALITFASCKKETTITEHDGSATISFDAKVGSDDFALNKDFTINNRTYNFTHLRYWVSNVTLIKADGSEYPVPNAYYLIEETNAQSVQDGAFQYPAKKREDVVLNDIPLAEYKAIKFSIGVDSKYNDNLSLQAGELSQLNGMTNISWMWHTTYIFTAVGGKVTEGATTKNIKVETGLNANYKTLTLNLPSNVQISSAKSTTLGLNVDVTKIIDGIDLVATPTVGASQATQMQAVANNYATKVFSAAISK